MSAYHNLFRLFNARLSRKIVFWVFLNIIAIELMILFPSVRKQERDLLNDLEHFSHSTVGLIQQNLLEGELPPLQPSEESDGRALQMMDYLELNSVVLGGQLYDTSGNNIYQSGRPPELSWTQVNREMIRHLRSDDGLYYDVAYGLQSSEQEYVLVLRHDASSIGPEIQAYIWRIAGLVAIISIFVTAATLLALGPLVIAPILQLRQDLVRAGKIIHHTQENKGDRNSEEWIFSSKQNRRNDELGETIIAFGQMYEQLIAEIGDRTAAESALQRLNQDLEYRVAQRTAQLNTEVQKSEQALADLQEAQVQLIHAGKMSSLGRIIAGIAHEINNPISFIYSNLDPATVYMQDLLDLIQLYQRHTPEPPAEIGEMMEEIDLDFLMEDLPRLLDSMQFGADRIRRLILSLRNFARLDETELKAIDIHEGIDSTLIILEHRLQPQDEHETIAVMKNYGHLPAITCYAGQMNQVFINLLENAIDAMEQMRDYYLLQPQESIGSFSPTLKIITKLARIGENDFAVIQIIDNGIGMTEEALLQAFDPFFTTKPVSDGMGLGLSIAYDIVVQKHGGQLDCSSMVGEGTTFEIRLPLH